MEISTFKIKVKPQNTVDLSRKLKDWQHTMLPLCKVAFLAFCKHMYTQKSPLKEQRPTIRRKYPHPLFISYFHSGRHGVPVRRNRQKQRQKQLTVATYSYTPSPVAMTTGFYCEHYYNL